MCGLVYISRKNNQPVGKMVLKRYRKQRSRGSDGFGFVAINQSNNLIVQRATSEKTIRSKIEKYQQREMMFHHRLPTSVPNFEETAHPIYVNNDKLKYDYYVVHNGIITNCSELKNKHEKRGFEYTTEYIQRYTIGKTEYISDAEFNDSESLAIELALYLENQKKEVEATGSIAFILLQVDKKTNKVISRYCGRNSNPLKAYRQKDFFSLTSEGCGIEIEKNKIFKIEYNALTTTRYRLPKHSQYSEYRTTVGFHNGRLFDDDYDWDDIVSTAHTKTFPGYEEKYYSMLEKLYDLENELHMCRYKGDRTEENKIQSEIDILKKNIDDYEEKYALDY